tara:strand:- start:531 stop:2201 length:1671 start_codon:yes stop_codon:yes gene_type:complete
MMASLIIAAAVTLAGTLILSGLVLVFDRLAPARFVRERHDFGLAVVLTIPLLFALACVPSSGSEISPLPEYRSVMPVDAAPFEPATTAVIARETRPAAAGPQSGFAWQFPPALIGILLALWAGGALMSAARLVLDLRALERLKAGARPVAAQAGLKLSHPVAMARTEAVTLPLLAGFLRPTILLPVDFVLDREARPVLEHEIAHVIRHDAWAALATRLVTTLFWWAFPLYPLLPVIDRTREILSDRRAAQITGAPRQLASALLDAAEIAVRTPSLTLDAAPSRSSLALRIGQLTDPESLNRKDSLMRLSLILPVMIAGSLVLTPHIGAATAGESTVSSAVSAPLRRLDDVRDPDTSLFRAAQRGRTDRLAELLAAGAEPDIRFAGDGTALIAAARNGDARAVDLLLEAGANPDLGVSGDGTPLIAAAKRGDRAIVDLLLEAGADINRAESGDGNALIAAALGGHPDMVSLLLAGGADPNAYVLHDETPLINAAQAGRVDIAELLVEAGADISMTVLAHGRDGQRIYRSPISEARRLGRGEMVRWLETQGAEHQPPL